MWYVSQENNTPWTFVMAICFGRGFVFATELPLGLQDTTGNMKEYQVKWAKLGPAFVDQLYHSSSLGWTAFGSGDPTGFGELRKPKMEPIKRGKKESWLLRAGPRYK